tara:strand:+ start:678 stop:1034 length:357 start_codon:yes stop_codon:yes gene_type:complete
MILTIIVLSFLLILSILLSVVLVWYNRQVVGELLFISENIGDTVGLLKEYHEHLEGLHEMEMFYGDETLRGLIEHTKFMTEELKVFEDIYDLTREEEETDMDDDSEPTDEEEADLGVK